MDSHTDIVHVAPDIFYFHAARSQSLYSTVIAKVYVPRTVDARVYAFIHTETKVQDYYSSYSTVLIFFRSVEKVESMCHFVSMKPICNALLVFRDLYIVPIF